MSNFDGYDYEEYQEEGNDLFAPAPRQVRSDIEADLNELIDIVSSAKQMPLSASALISREQVLGLLEQALNNLPEEIREARRALRDREALMAAEVTKATQLMDQVKAEAARMVDKTEIVRQSRARGEQLVIEAQVQSRQMIAEAEDFIDGRLGNFEIVLERLLKTARSGRERLSSQGIPASLVGEGTYDVLDSAPATMNFGDATPPLATPSYDEESDGGVFFDQDVD